MWCTEEHLNPGQGTMHPTAPVAIATPGGAVLQVEPTLRVPVGDELRHNVRTLLCRGERSIVLDLRNVSAIDAAGVGQLVRAYNLTRAVNGTLRITHAAPKVREMLVRAGLFDLLSAAPGWRPQAVAS
jgi:anti-anti-sigma factor